MKEQVLNRLQNETHIEIEATEYGFDEKVSDDIIASAFLVEDDFFHSAIVSKVKLTGRYTKEYKIISDLVELKYNRLLVDKNFLLVCFNITSLLLTWTRTKL